jgi:glycosyltransferase involved in cell wall biosynthesis
VTIHDVSFSAHPEWFSFREGIRRRVLTKLSARRATTIVTVSDFSAEEIANAYGVPPGNIHVIRHGVTHVPRASPVPREPLVLFVGSIFNRRHVPELMAAVRQLLPHVRDLRLVIAGENRTKPRQDLGEEAARLKIAAVTELADYVDDARLAALYARARVLVFVSDYEGFRLTPLEALAAGVPPVVGDTKVAHETCGDAALYVRPGDVDALAMAIRTLLVDDHTRTRLLEAAPAIMGRYSWDRAAEETLRVIEAAARR